MLSRLLLALGLAAALVSWGAVAVLRTEFVANNLCSYAVATIEEATAAEVRVARCEVHPEAGQLTIEGLQVGDSHKRIDLKVARVFVHVVVRPFLQKVRLERLEIDRPELHLSLEAQGESPPSGGTCLPSILDRFELGRVNVRRARVEVSTTGAHVQLPAVAVHIHGRGDKLRVQVATQGGIVELPGRAIGLLSSRTSADVDLRGQGELGIRRADWIGTDGSVYATGALRDFCHPRLEAQVNARADDLESAFGRLLPGVLPDVKGGLSFDGTVAVDPGGPRARGDLKLSGVRLGEYEPGDVRLKVEADPRRLRVERLEAPVLHGGVTGTVQLAFSEPGLPLQADLHLKDVELAEVLRRVGVRHVPVVLRTSGRAQLHGRLQPFALSGDAALDLADFSVLDRPWEQRRAAVRQVEIPRARLQAQLSIDPDQVIIRRGALGLGDARLEVDATLATDVKKGLQLLVHGSGVNFDSLANHLGSLDLKGAVDLEASVVGPYAGLRVEGTAAAHELHLLQLALGDVTTRFGLTTSNLRLSFEELKGVKDRTRYAGRLSVELSGESPLDARLEVQEGRLHDLVTLAEVRVPTLSSLHSAEDVDGAFAGTLAAHGPAASPDASAELRFSDVSLWQERFDTGRARLSLHGAEPRLQVDELWLQHGAKARVELEGRFGPRWELDLSARSREFTLADLDPATPLRLSGALQATARVRGVADHPLVEAAVRFPEGRAGNARLGAGDLGLQLDGKELKWSGTVGEHSLSGHSLLVNDFAYTSSVRVRIPELTAWLDVLLPEADVQAGALSATLDLEGSLLDWRRSRGVVRLDELRIVRNDLEFHNDGVGLLSFGPDGLHVQHLALKAPYTTATLEGDRARDGRLDLHLLASIDGRLLAGLVPDLEHAAGRYEVQAALGGTAEQPSVLGSLRVSGGELRLRGLPVSLRELEGGVSFSQDALVIDSLAGKLNNGDLRLAGGMVLKGLHPQRIDMSAHVGEAGVQLQDNLSATLDGDLTLEGTPREPTLGGNVVVSRLRYTEDLDLERSLLDFSRRPPSPRVLTKSAVLVHYDLDVHLSRGVRIENNLARADLKGDLKLTGTSRSPGLLGSLNTVRGTATFRGNDFQIDQGIVTFTDPTRIRASFDLQAASQVRAASEEYKIRLHAFGTPAEPHVQLSSEPALAEADLGFLLAFGFVSRDLQQASFGAADSGLAIGVEALNKMTGFSEEVRRFIPKNAILRDPNIDFASDFSGATNRLEPMARFRSHLLTDRMDVRVLQGLTTKRYRGMVSYQLSDALSTQLQVDNEHITSGTELDLGLDLRLKLEGE